MTPPETIRPAGLATDAPPVWDVTDSHGFGRGFRRLWEVAADYFTYYIVCKGNRAAYLRTLGVRIGADCEILTSAKNFGSEPWLIEIGQRVTVTQGVLFLTHDGANRVFRHLLTGSSPWGNRFSTIRVRDNSFVGANSIIMPGVEIGPNSIVGTGSVVNRDVPPNTVVAGVPAKVICTLDEYIERYQSKWVTISATSRAELRAELTQLLWGERR